MMTATDTFHTVSKTFSFCYGHRLMGDSGRCRHLHGHTARATIVLRRAELDEKGMVFHFDRIKETIGAWITEHIDHKLLLSKGDPLCPALEAVGENFRAVPFNPTAESIAKWIFGETKGFGLPVVRVDVWESETSMASYEEW